MVGVPRGSVSAQYQGTVERPYIRGNIALANPEICGFLEAEHQATRSGCAHPGLAGQDRIPAKRARSSGRCMRCAPITLGPVIRHRARREPFGCWRTSRGTAASFIRLSVYRHQSGNE
jgi:hypothetical protein